MKHIIVAIIVVVTVLSLGIYEECLVTDTLDEVISSCNDIISALENNDIEGAKRITADITTLWQDRRERLELFFTHSEFKDVPLLIAELDGYLNKNNIEEASVRAYILKADAITHKKNLSFSYENIL